MLAHVGQGMFGPVPVGFVVARLGKVSRVMETTCTVGVIAASMPRGGMGHGVLGSRWMGQCGFGQCVSCHGNHHRAGTEADRRGRGGMYLSGAWFVSVGSVSARQVSFRWGWSCCVPVWKGQSRKPHPCRHGSRSTREVWDVSGWCKARHSGFRCVPAWQVSTKLVQARGRINAGGLGCIKARSGRVWFVAFCSDTVERGRSRLCKARRC